jgi:hypothetical protein
LIDHDAVTIQPRFGLHDSVEVLEVARVEADRRIEINVLGVREYRCRRIGRLRQRYTFIRLP